MGYWGGRGDASHRGWGEKEVFRLFQKRNCISKGVAEGKGRTHVEKGECIGVVPKCMLGGNAGQFDNRVPRRQSGPQVHAGRECWQVCQQRTQEAKRKCWVLLARE